MNYVCNYVTSIGRVSWLSARVAIEICHVVFFLSSTIVLNDFCDVRSFCKYFLHAVSLPGGNMK
jgi:hypothetical protein